MISNRKRMRSLNAIFIVQPGQVEIRDIPMPVPLKGEALLKPLYGGDMRQ